MRKSHQVFKNGILIFVLCQLVVNVIKSDGFWNNISPVPGRYRPLPFPGMVWISVPKDASPFPFSILLLKVSSPQSSVIRLYFVPFFFSPVSRMPQNNLPFYAFFFFSFFKAALSSFAASFASFFSCLFSLLFPALCAASHFIFFCFFS